MPNSILLKIFVWVSVFGGAIYFIMIPHVNGVLDKQQELRKQTLDYESIQTTFNDINSSISSFNEVVSDEGRERLDLVVPGYANNPETYILLLRLAARSGLREASIGSGGDGETIEGSKNSLSFTISATSDYDSLIVFLKNLEHSLRIFHVENILIERIVSEEDDEGVTIEDELKSSISVRTYFYGKQ